MRKRFFTETDRTMLLSARRRGGVFPGSPGVARYVFSLALALVMALAVSLALLTSGVAEASGTLPSGFRESVAMDGLNEPTAVEFAEDGRVFVAEKRGAIKVFDDLSDTTPTTFWTWRTNVHNFWDRGLLGMALDPDFPNKPYVYVLYTHDAPVGGTAPHWGQPSVDSDSCPTPPGPTDDGCVASGRLLRLQADGNVSSGSKVLIEDWCQQYPSHSVGDLAFGRDGALYVSAGDGASFSFVDYGQDGDPPNPCGDPPAGRGGSQTPPSAEGGALRSQDLRTSGDPTGLNGTILRVDPETGDALPDNPLYGNPDPSARRIIAHGFRNPFRIATRPGTDEVWAGDVGWGAFEELNRIDDPTGSTAKNFGWPCYEGAGRQGGYDGTNLNICEDLYRSTGAVTEPFYAYAHNEQVTAGELCPTGGGSAIVGPAFYEGGSYPDAYDGAVFFADTIRGCIWTIREGADGTPDPATRETFKTGAHTPVELKTGPGGDLFYVDFFGGAIHRISYDAGSTTACPTGEYRAEYYAGSQTPGGTPTFERCETQVDHDWGLEGPGNGVGTDDFSARWLGKHEFEAGEYTFAATADDGVRMWVDDELIIDEWRDQGASTFKATRAMTAGEHEVRVEYYENGGDAVAQVNWQKGTNAPPAATIGSPSSALKWKVGDRIDFSGSASDPEDGTLPESALSWDLIMNHCSPGGGCHKHPIESFDGVSSGSFAAPDHEYPSHLELRLTATDSRGRQGTESVRLDPQTVELTFDSNPSGLQLVAGSEAEETPFSRTVIVGSKNSVSAPSPQAAGGTEHGFASWSDGGAQSHEIVAGAEPSKYTATYGTAPTISDQRPVPSSSTRGRRPPISATVRDAETDLAKSNIELYLDNRTVTAFSYDQTTDRLSYTSGRLSYGWHTVKVVARDEQGLSETSTWHFRVRR